MACLIFNGGWVAAPHQRLVSTLGLHNEDLSHPAGVPVQGLGTDKGSPNTYVDFLNLGNDMWRKNVEDWQVLGR